MPRISPKRGPGHKAGNHTASPGAFSGVKNIVVVSVAWGRAGGLGFGAAGGRVFLDDGAAGDDGDVVVLRRVALVGFELGHEQREEFARALVGQLLHPE